VTKLKLTVACDDYDCLYEPGVYRFDLVARI
jgi:hypothetical protein